LFPGPTREKLLPLFLVGALLLCHGVFGTLHLVCYSPECAGDAEHQAAAGAVGNSHEHPVDHATGTEYFALVVVGLLGLLLGLLREGTPLRIRWYAVLRRVLAVLFHPPPTLTPLVLQVFRL